MATGNLTQQLQIPERPDGGQPRSRSVRRGNTLGKLMAYVLLTLGGLVMFLPLVWLVSSSLKSPADIFVMPPRWIPDPPQWSNYREVMQQLPFLRYLINTLIITGLVLVGQTLSASVSAFAFARLRWPGRDVIFAVLIATMMVPYTVTMIPTFILFRNFGWLDTFLPLTVPAFFGGSAFFVFLLRQFFRTIPMDLDESARLDGASSFRILWDIILPNSRPALAVVMIFSFMATWNDFFGPLIYLQSADNRTLALGLMSLQGLAWGRDMTHLVMAVSVIMVAPVIVLFFFAQRTFIQGIVLTGIKG